MQNADSTVSSPAPSGPGIKRKRSISSQIPPFGANRTKKIPREIVNKEIQSDDVEMEDISSTPAPFTPATIENGMRNGSSVAGAAAIAAATKVLSDSEEWQRTIERIVKSVVAIRFCQVLLQYYKIN
jgi:hypothetical protein